MLIFEYKGERRGVEQRSNTFKSCVISHSHKGGVRILIRSTNTLLKSTVPLVARVASQYVASVYGYILFWHKIPCGGTEYCTLVSRWICVVMGEQD